MASNNAAWNMSKTVREREEAIRNEQNESEEKRQRKDTFSKNETSVSSRPKLFIKELAQCTKAK